MVEADRRWVQATSRWTALRAMRGRGEPVQEKGDTTSNITDEGRYDRGGNKRTQKVGGDSVISDGAKVWIDPYPS